MTKVTIVKNYRNNFEGSYILFFQFLFCSFRIYIYFYNV